MPLSFSRGEACQFSRSHEIVVPDGGTTTVKVAHLCLCYSCVAFVRSYPRQTQQMVFDAHSRAFTSFQGACTRGIYDNIKTAVEAVFVGEARAFNRHGMSCCVHRSGLSGCEYMPDTANSIWGQ